MIKKITTVFFIVLTNIILLGHVVIPHHHHKTTICLEDSILENQEEVFNNTAMHHHACMNHIIHNDKHKKTKKNHKDRSHFCPLIQVQAILEKTTSFRVKTFENLHSFNFIDFLSADLLVIETNNQYLTALNLEKFKFITNPYSFFSINDLALRGPPTV